MDEQEKVPEEAGINEAAAPVNDEAKKPLKKKSKPDKQKERIAELEDRLLRQIAEFENFRKRSDKEKTQMFEVGAKSVIEKILPIVDNFERGLAALPETEAGTPFAEGMNMVYKQLLGELESLEVKLIPAVGTEFDPELHNAVMQMASEEYESGIVAQEMQKGYTYRGNVIRHSLVAVVE
jgi:molecular chaperone GrpE